MGRSLLAGSIAVVLTACASLAGPEYERPATPTKAAWSQSAEAQVSPREVVRPDWWTGFRDPYLDSLVQQAIAENLDLKILVARIDQAAAEFGGAEDQFLPTLTAGTSAQYTRSRGASRGGSFRQTSDRQYGASAQLNWEIDIWGKLRKATDAAEANYRATEADWRAAYLGVIATVANTYFQIRLLDEQVIQQQQALANNERILGIYESLRNDGIVATTAVLSQKAEINRLQNQLLELQRLRILAENSLATLLGKPAGNFTVPVAQLRQAVQLLNVPIGLPSELISRRPDIVAAEYRVLAAHNLIGEARLARLPSIRLTGSGGGASSAFSNLLKTWTLGIGPFIDIPIFDPSIETNIQFREASAREAEEQYRQTVLNAFQEVEDALINLAFRQEQKKELEAEAAQLRAVRERIHTQLEIGIVSRLDVFESERSLLQAEQELLAIHQLILSDTVTLYKALGGGWPEQAIGASAMKSVPVSTTQAL
jgi:NodT family efflux transporter outer membrane factor (OMF) lipoprotein